MTTTVDALKALYVKLGGTAADVANVVTIPDMIDAVTSIAEAGSGGGSGGGSSALIVSAEMKNGTDYTLDKTLGEIKTAAAAGSLVMLHTEDLADFGISAGYFVMDWVHDSGVAFGAKTYQFGAGSDDDYPLADYS